MNLTILDKNYEVENNENGINELFNIINTELTQANSYYSHMLVDGKEIYSDEDVYLLEQLTDIEVVEVKTKTIEEFVNNLLVSLHEYTNRAIPEIEKLINEYYQSPTENSWLTLNQLFQGIEWLFSTIKSIDETQNTIENWNEFLKSSATFEMELPNLLEAMENKDLVLIADIIQYEILPQFKIINSESEKNFEVRL